MQSPARRGATTRLLTVTGVTGTGYTLSWIAGLSIPRAARRSGRPAAARAALVAGLAPIVGVAGTASAVLPRWLRFTGIALAVALVCSGVPYPLLWSGGAVLAYLSGPLLLLFITGSGIALGRPTDHLALNQPEEGVPLPWSSS